MILYAVGASTTSATVRSRSDILMKIKVRPKKKYPWGDKKPWELGSGTGVTKGSNRRPEDAPLHINGRTWKPKPGPDGVPKDQDMASVKRLGTQLQHEVLRCFRDGHLNTGDFQRWVRMNKNNMAMFYKWVLCDIITKSVQLSVIGGDGATPDEMPLVVRIEQRKEAKK